MFTTRIEEVKPKLGSDELRDKLRESLTQSAEFGSVLHWSLGHDQHHRAILLIKTCYQAFRHDRANLLFREIDHCDHLPAEQVLCLVKIGDLSAGFPQANLIAEIYFKFPSRLSGFWEFADFNDCTDTQFHLCKFIPSNFFHIVLEILFVTFCDRVKLYLDLKLYRLLPHKLLAT